MGRHTLGARLEGGREAQAFDSLQQFRTGGERILAKRDSKMAHRWGRDLELLARIHGPDAPQVVELRRWVEKFGDAGLLRLVRCSCCGLPSATDPGPVCSKHRERFPCREGRG